MDKFVTSKKPTYQKSHRKESVCHKYEPYPTKCVNDALDPNNGASNLKVYTQRTLTQHLLNTLMDKSNPITHSDIGLRSG